MPPEGDIGSIVSEAGQPDEVDPPSARRRLRASPLTPLRLGQQTDVGLDGPPRQQRRVLERRRRPSRCRPRSGRRSAPGAPTAIRSSVDFLQPDGPTIPRRSHFSSRARSTWSTAWVPSGNVARMSWNRRTAPPRAPLGSSCGCDPLEEPLEVAISLLSPRCSGACRSRCGPPGSAYFEGGLALAAGDAADDGVEVGCWKRTGSRSGPAAAAFRGSRPDAGSKTHRSLVRRAGHEISDVHDEGPRLEGRTSSQPPVQSETCRHGAVSILVEDGGTSVVGVRPARSWPGRRPRRQAR